MSFCNIKYLSIILLIAFFIVGCHKSCGCQELPSEQQNYANPHLAKLLLEGDFETALPIAQAQVKQRQGGDDPTALAVAYIDLGSVYLGLKNEEKANENFEKGLQLLPRNGSISQESALEAIIFTAYFLYPDLAVTYLERLATLKKELYGENSQEYQKVLTLLKKEKNNERPVENPSGRD